MYVTIDLCLLCLTSNTDLKSTFSKDNDGVLIEKKLNYFLLERVNIDPDISKYICLPCLKNINFFYNYKQQCLQNIDTLNSYMYKLKYAKVPSRNKLQITLIDIKNIKLNRKSSETKIGEPITTENNNLVNAIETDETETQNELQDKHNQTADDEILRKDYVEPESDDSSDNLGNDDSLAIECADVSNNGENNEKQEEHVTTGSMEPMIVDDKLNPTFVEVNVKNEPIDSCDEINITPGQNETAHCSKNTPQEPLNVDLDLKYTDKLDTTFVAVPIKVEPNEYFYDGIESTSNVQDDSQSAYNSNNESQIEATSIDRAQNVAAGGIAIFENLPFECTYCPEKFRKKYLLKKHLGLHTGGRPYECTHCPKRFKTSAHLGRHIFLHGEKPFKCDICYKLYSNEEDLVTHKHRAHISERHYVCNICYKRFVSNSDLIRHTNVHTGERSYKCEVCNKSFTRPDNLNKHLKCHNSKQMRCSMCPFTCSAAYYLHRHLKKEHKNEQNTRENSAENDSSEDEPQTSNKFQEHNQTEEVEEQIFIKDEYIESECDDELPTSTAVNIEEQPKPKDIGLEFKNKDSGSLNNEIQPQNVSLAVKCADVATNIGNNKIQEESIITGDVDPIVDDKIINPTFDEVIIKEEPKVNFYDETNVQTGLDYGPQNLYNSNVRSKIATAYNSNIEPHIAAAYTLNPEPQTAAAYTSIIPPQIQAPYNLNIGPQVEMTYNNSIINQKIAAAYNSIIQSEIAYNNAIIKPEIQAAYSLNPEPQIDTTCTSSGLPRITIAYNSNGELQVEPPNNPNVESQIPTLNTTAHSSNLEPDQNTTDPRRFKCSFCSKIFKKRTYLTNHVRQAHGDRTEKRYKCTTCSKSFHRRANLVRHHRLIHKRDESFKCDVCQKPYISKTTLEKHMLLHTNDTPYVCNICLRGFTNASNLRTHTLVHTGEKPYKCEVCDEMFTLSSNLAIHMRNHADEKLFTCNVCPFNTTSSKELNHHKYMHILPHLPFQEKNV